jgi:hypothetical protein
VVVDNFDVFGMPVAPEKANPPLTVDPNRELTLAIALESLKAVGRRIPEIV